MTTESPISISAWATPRRGRGSACVRSLETPRHRIRSPWRRYERSGRMRTAIATTGFAPSSRNSMMRNMVLVIPSYLGIDPLSVARCCGSTRLVVVRAGRPQRPMFFGTHSTRSSRGWWPPDAPCRARSRPKSCMTSRPRLVVSRLDELVDQRRGRGEAHLARLHARRAGESYGEMALARTWRRP
jgi:hypothetical protein